MVGGLFGVHNIDMGMCSSFARVFDIRKKKSFFFIHYLLWDGYCRIASFLSFQSIFLIIMCFYLSLSRFSASHGLFSRVKSAWQDTCVLWKILGGVI